MSNLKVRVLRDTDGFKDVEDIQRSAWDFGDLNTVPAHILEALSKYDAGLVIGAYFEGQMVGFILVMETRDKKIQLLHMIGVIHNLQCGRGGMPIGETLFRFYGQEAARRGIEEVKWTFDPLLGQNASLYFHKLGAKAKRYIPNAYSETEKAGIYNGLPADRLLVGWRVDTFRNTSLTNGEHPPLAGLGEIGNLSDFSVEIPIDINQLKESNLELAMKARLDSRAIFEKALSMGYNVADFVHQKERGRNLYIFHRGG